MRPRTDREQRRRLAARRARVAQRAPVAQLLLHEEVVPAADDVRLDGHGARALERRQLVLPRPEWVRRVGRRHALPKEWHRK